MINYRTIYTLPFKSIKEVSYLIEIQKENYEGESIELIGSGDSPFSISIEDEDFLYVPTRFSTATIRIIGGDYLQSLFSISYQQYRVIFKCNNVVIWCGFIKPELYTQDYSSDMFELELECISAMSVLEFIDYKQQGENREFISLWALLKKCIASSNSQYTAIYFPHVYAKNADDYASGVNVLEQMTISEQNFFDEDDKPMKLKEVLEETCKFLNWTCVDWRGELYFIDIDHVGEYYKYDLDLIRQIGYVNPVLSNIRNIGFAGSDHLLDILSGYNKVTVRDSNYCFDSAIPEEDFKKLKSFTKKKSYSYDKYNEVRQYLKSESYEFPHYFNNSLQTSENNITIVDESVTDVYIDDPTTLFLGGYLAKRCSYMIENGNPSITDWNWEYVYEFKLQSEYAYSYPSTVPPTGDEQETPDWKPPMIVEHKHIPYGVVLMRYKNNQPIKYYDGAFGISMGIQSCIEYNMTSCRSRYLNWSGGIKNYSLLCRLRIGDFYYNGSNWVKYNQDLNENKPTFEIYMGDVFNSVEWSYISDGKTLDMPYEGLKGYIVEIPDNINLFGCLEFELLKTDWINIGINFKDIKIDFKKKNVDEDDDSEENNSDRIYENVVNENYINELDEIEFKISSYNHDGTCYSKVMLGDNYLTSNLYSSIENTLIRPEELLIRRIINQYGATKIKLTQVLKNSDSITPISILNDSYMKGKNFIVTGGEIDFASEQFTCKMIES